MSLAMAIDPKITQSESKELLERLKPRGGWMADRRALDFFGDFNLDGKPQELTPEFELESPSSEPALEQDLGPQPELYLPVDEVTDESQLGLDGMAAPVYAVYCESNNPEIDGSQLQFKNAATLLESLEQARFPVAYQCRDGYCGACRCKKIEGDVAYLKEPMAMLNEDEILPCVSVPKSNLKIKL